MSIPQVRESLRGRSRDPTPAIPPQQSHAVTEPPRPGGRKSHVQLDVSFFFINFIQISSKVAVIVMNFGEIQ